MRIIGGALRGKQIIAPSNLPVRPTTDFAKEGLFNILNNRIDFEDLTVLDLFSGTGNISLEFASRGAKKITSIDMHSPCVNFVRETAKSLKLTNVFTERSDAFKYIDKCTYAFDLIFADPPYELPNLETIPELVFSKNILNPDAWFIIEHGPRTDFSSKPFFVDTRKYGNVNFSFFKNTIAS